MNKDLFLKNTQALFEVDQPLAYRLRSLEKIDFKILQNENGINFIKDDIALYKNPNQELLENLTLFKSEYEKYPVLFFYGFGNGMFYKALCENKNHKHIIIFEDELEILALAFHFFDFTQELKNEKILLFHTSSLTSAQLNTLFSYPYIQTSMKIFNLFIHCDFYVNFFTKNIENLNAKLIQTIRFITLNKGNDPQDSLVGIKHTLNNLEYMLNHSVFQNFLKERRAKVKNAIIVATGPSLAKQLPLLKEYVGKASIFCADSSYPILAKHGIKPDYVLSLERIPLTSEFFNNDFKDFDKDILFIITALTHENTIKYLEQNHRNYMLVHRPLYSAANLKLDDFGYLGVGASVANMAYELASVLRHENIILIGQDLAYDDKGSSHTKDYVNINLHKDDYQRDKDKFNTTAYGGKGTVQSSLVWNLFRQFFEKDIFFTKEKLGITTYNCTEGGARIEGSIEKPFKEACENLLKEDLIKPFKLPKNLDKTTIDDLFRKTKQRLHKYTIESKNFITQCQKELQKLKYELEKENKNFKTLEKIQTNLLKLSKEFKQLKLFNELTQALHFHNECEIVKFQVLKDDIQKENLELFLKIQYNFFSQALGYLDAQNNIIKQALKTKTKNPI
ncbi:motility associated factor glycosyltransferase family protein [Campylobacter jejuni]|uniref:motility associated factor glycosyltransferase family protein n=1 Tax=Campylobacter jejuni TaxID=197 RepID=UPI000F804FEF|nr:motility associated factor glycosyltransferase family protein [Campylobacter jejuni]RTI64632.1 motility accessory factor [Campylobacter jejuni]RTI68894.1 motility accessory factor [Campylobacter jejuni]RTI78328.1 motility accessory factor [Campylobacter jejuni]RTI98015.1 motility accessory factor [Campylobacter jejuni]